MQLSLLDLTHVGAGAAVSGDRPEQTRGAPCAPCMARDAGWERLRRVDLGDGAWLEMARGFVPAHRGLFRLLEQGSDWEQHERQMYERVVPVPRLVASCPGRQAGRPWQGEALVRVVQHGASADEVATAASTLRDFQAALSRHYARRLSSIALAFYRDGSDSVAFHGDKLGPLRKDTIVAILSLGAPRHFLLRRAPGRPGALPPELVTSGFGVVRSRNAGRSSFALSVGEGDLMVMGGTCQETWEHAVPKEAVAGPRIAVMFREAWDEREGGIRNVRGPLRQERDQEPRRLRGAGSSKLS